MNYKSLKFKIFLIFSIPAIAIIYFSYSLVESKYRELKESSLNSLSAKITASLNTMMHNIQIERGLSAGYLVSKDEILKQQLLLQYNKTDEAYKNMLSFIQRPDTTKVNLYALLGEKNRPFITKTINQLHDITIVRQDVLNANIKFQDEIDYYSSINQQLLNTIATFMNYLDKQRDSDNYALTKLQSQKEIMGLIRAFVYSQILSQSEDPHTVELIKNLILTHNLRHDEFYLRASIPTIAAYNKAIDAENYHKIFLIQERVLQGEKLEKKEAKVWFKMTTQYINELENLSDSMIESALQKTYEVQKSAKETLYFVLILWILSLFAFFFLIYILKKLIDSEKEHNDELRIASYTFDSHEAMAITDLDANIIRVNKAFTRITGYTPQEVLGKNPRILKSDRHSDSFFQNMWYQLLTVGKWSDEIYNKRKNGDVYLERLSITAIKDDNNRTTHYIAQFLDISDLKNAQLLAQYQADHDYLTGLLNRKALTQRLEEEFSKAKRHNFLHAFLFIDLDHFKAVNDNYGHLMGDKVLVAVTKRVQKELREGDIFSRMSGDEFAIVLLNLNKDEAIAKQEIQHKCSKLLDIISKEYIIDDAHISIGASIGISLFPKNAKSAQEVIVNADKAMYKAKKNGKHQFCFY